MKKFRTTLHLFVLPIAFCVSMVWVVGGAWGQNGKTGGGRVLSPAEKLGEIIVPRVEISEAALVDAVEFLRIRSEDLDSTVAAGRPGRGMNFILKDPSGELSEKELSLTLSRVPLKSVLDYVTRFVGASYRIDAHAVVIGKADDLRGEAGMVEPGRIVGNGRRVFERLRDTRLPSVSIEDASIDEVIQYFRAVSVREGRGTGVAGEKGVNFVLKNPAEELPGITLHMRDVPMGTALRYACELSGLVYTVHPNAVVIGQADALSPRRFDPGAEAYGRSGVRPGGATNAAKLKGLVIPVVELESVTLEEALDLVRAMALQKERAAGVKDPKGINIVNLAQDNTQRISLSLTEIPAWELMGYITGLTETDFRVERLAVLVDWKLPRRELAEKDAGEADEASPVLKVPQVPDVEGAPKVLQVPVINRDDPFGLLPGAPLSPLVVPGL